MSESDAALQPEPQMLAPEQPKAAPPTRKPVKRIRRRQVISQPVYESSLTVSSQQAFRVMFQQFRPLSRSLFNSDVIIRIIGDNEAADALENHIQEMFESVQEDMATALHQARALLTQHTIEVMPKYTNPHTFKFKIKSPQIVAFIDLVGQLDQLMIQIDALWINKAVSNKQRSMQTYQWQQRLMKLSNRIKNLEARARSQAYKMGKGSEVEEQAPEDIEDEESEDENTEESEQDSEAADSVTHSENSEAA